jgi:iron complex outermembrane receptor protein
MAVRGSWRLAAISGLPLLAMPAHAQRMDYDALRQAVGEPVTTSVTGKPQRQSETPASTIIITHDEIARSPAKDVPGLLKTYAGIDVNRWTAGQSDVAVRGGVQTYNPRLLVLVNGRQVYLDHYGMTNWNLLGVQLEEIQQIELVRGPAGALFGFNAASGVVNIITNDPLMERKVSAAVETGNHGYGRIAGAVSMPVGDAIGVRLSGGHMREDERRVPADQFRPLRADDVTRNDVSATIDAALDAQTQVSLTGGFADNRQLELLVTQISSEQRYKTGDVGLHVDRDTPWGSLTGQIYNNWLRARYGIGSNDPGKTPIAALQTFDLSARTFVAQTSTLVRLGGEDTARIGVEYRDNRLNSGVTFSRVTGYSVVSANAMIDTRLADPLMLNVAGRIDRLQLSQSGTIAPVVADSAASFERTFTTFSFNAGAVFQPVDRQTLRLNGGRAVQAPSLVVFGMNIAAEFVGVPLPVIVAGDPSIKPVEVWSAELAYDYKLSDALELKTAAFFTRTNNAIAYPGDDPALEVREQPSPFLVARVANVGDFRTYGLDLTAFGVIRDRLTWRANYTYTATNEALPGSSPAIKYSFLPDEATARHKANLVLGYNRGRWSGSIVGRYTSATHQISTRPDTFLELVDVHPALALDAKIGVRLGERISVWAAGENLTGALGATGSPFPADTRLRTGASLSF